MRVKYPKNSWFYAGEIISSSCECWLCQQHSGLGNFNLFIKVLRNFNLFIKVLRNLTLSIKILNILEYFCKFSIYFEKHDNNSFSHPYFQNLISRELSCLAIFCNFCCWISWQQHILETLFLSILTEKVICIKMCWHTFYERLPSHSANFVSPKHFRT